MEPTAAPASERRKTTKNQARNGWENADLRQVRRTARKAAKQAKETLPSVLPWAGTGLQGQAKTYLRMHGAGKVDESTSIPAYRSLGGQ